MPRPAALDTPEAKEKQKQNARKYRWAHEKKREKAAELFSEIAPGDWALRGYDSMGRGFSKREKDTQINRALERTEKSVDRVFAFLNKLVTRGVEILDKKGEPSPVELTLISEARMASLKFLDKAVADASATPISNHAGTAVQIVIGAPLTRMIQGGAPLIVESSNGREQDQVQAESLGDENS